VKGTRLQGGSLAWRNQVPLACQFDIHPGITMHALRMGHDVTWL